MKKYFILILWVFCLFSFKSYTEDQLNNNCDCLIALRGYKDMYKKCWIGPCSKESPSYPYHLQSTSIKSNLILEPSLYIEYYHNLKFYNESILNHLNYKTNQCNTFPTVYGNDIDTLREQHMKSIETNYETDEYVKSVARIVYKNCHKKHLNPLALYDNSFLEFIEGNSEKSAELAEKYISVCKEKNIDHHSTSAELLLLGQAHIETAQYIKAIDVLSDLIQNDPLNKEARFHRATAYFENGNYDEALIDIFKL